VWLSIVSWHLISPKRLAKSDPMVVCSIEESGSISLLEQENSTLRSVCLKHLQEDFVGGAEIIKSDPVGSFHETVQEKSGRVVMNKSPNKHNPSLHGGTAHGRRPC